MTCDSAGHTTGTIQHNKTNASKIFIWGHVLGVFWMGGASVAAQHACWKQLAYNVVKGSVVSKSLGWQQCQWHDL